LNKFSTSLVIYANFLQGIIFVKKSSATTPVRVYTGKSLECEMNLRKRRSLTNQSSITTGKFKNAHNTQKAPVCTWGYLGNRSDNGHTKILDKYQENNNNDTKTVHPRILLPQTKVNQSRINPSAQ